MTAQKPDKKRDDKDKFVWKVGDVEVVPPDKVKKPKKSPKKKGKQ